MKKIIRYLCVDFVLKCSQLDTEDLSCDESRSECQKCVHKRNVPGNCHIECVKPDANMRGSLHGIKRGWFMYPILFDPTWKLRKCGNFTPVESCEDAVSGAVGGVVSESKAQ